MDKDNDVWYHVERLEELRRRDKYIDALYKTGAIVGLGTTFYLGWFMYHFSNDMMISVRNSLGELVTLDFPPVNPWLKTGEARNAYIECLQKEYGKVD